MSFQQRSEFTIAAFAREYARAAQDLNPYLEADSLSLGNGVAVYAGQFSPVHGVYGLGLEAELIPADFQELEDFFEHAGRAMEFWVVPETNITLLSYLNKNNYFPEKKQNVFSLDLSKLPGQELPKDFLTTPDHAEWALQFSEKKEASLFATTLFHLRNTRFYSLQGSAAYTFFQDKYALSMQESVSQASLLAAILQQAKEFRCENYLYVLPDGAEPQIPALWEKKYQRICYKKKEV